MSEQKIRVWNRVGERMPPPHARYEVFCLSGKNLLATPCYGMHEPWWVPFADGKEGPPFAMEDRDEWREQEPAPTQAAPGDKALTGLDEFKQKLMAYADLDNTAAHSYLVITTLLAAATQRAEAADRDAKRLDWLL